MADNKQTPKNTTGNKMLENLQASVSGYFERADAGRSLAAIGLLSASIAGVVAATMWINGSNYVPLYGNQEHFDTSSIVQTLESEGINYEVQLKDGSIWVPKDKLASARMKMATNGIAAESPGGMETLDQYSGISTSQFMEGNRYNYAIEGELAKTIMSLDGVSRARVHLAIPERTLFIGRDEQKPTASVAIDVTRPLDASQVEAIINLVSGSVTGMKPESVSVVDQRGNLLSSNLMSKTPAKVSVQQMDYIDKLESRISRRAGDMLDPVLGADNYRIRVAADVDFSQIEETREVLEGDPVLVSESGMKDTSAEAMAGGIPGSLSNQAPMSEKELEELGITEPLANEREEYNRKFATGRSVTHKTEGESRIRQLSVSVLINDKVAPEGGWTDEKLDEFKGMINRAAGIKEDRGDELFLATGAFAEVAPPAAYEPSTLETVGKYIDILKMPFIAIITILLILFGVRPIAKYLTTARPQSAARNNSAATEENDANADGTVTSSSASNPMSYELPSAESELSVQVEHLKMLAEKEAPRVTEIVKTWVRSND